MCEICRQSPCDPRCPCADQPEEICSCKICGEPICEGDEYYDMDGECYCVSCFEDNAVEILVEECGATLLTAGE